MNAPPTTTSSRAFRLASAAAAVAAGCYLVSRIADLALAWEFMIGRRMGLLSIGVGSLHRIPSVIFTLLPLAILALDAFFVLEQIVFALANRRRLSRSSSSSTPSPPPSPSPLPFVTVLIPVTREPLEVVQQTLEAAARLAYPADRFEVLVLDDADRADLVELLAATVAALDGEGPSLALRCRAREKQPTGGYKAGNLNFGVACAREDASAFLLLDADQVPLSSALATLAPFAGRARFGFVQAPQTYRNAGIDDAWDRPCREMHQVAQAYRAHLDAVMLTGTSALVSRAALAEVGGFDERTVTEDIVTGARIQAAGFATFYVEDEVAHGLVPTTKADLLRQRLRWATGTFQLGLLMPGLVRKLGARRVLAYFAGALHYVTPVALLLVAAVPAVVMAAGADAALFWSTRTLVALTSFAALRFVARQLYCRRTIVELGGGAFLSLALGGIYAAAALRALLSRRVPFRVTPKAGAGDDVRSRVLSLLLLAPALAIAFANGVGLSLYTAGIVAGALPLGTALVEYGGVMALGAWFLVCSACAVLVPVVTDDA